MSETKQSMSETKQSMSESKQSMSESKQSMSESKQSMSESKQSMSESKQSMSESKQVVSKSTKQLHGLLLKYKQMRQTYLDCYRCVSDIRDEIRSGKYDMNAMVNTIYILRDISKFSEDLRKECNGVEQIAINVACAIWVTNEQDNPIRAALATGTPNVKIAAAIPNQRREPEAFNAFMNALGVDTTAIANNTVKPYWPGVMEHISNLAEEGKPLPAGINIENTYTRYSMRITPYKGLDEVLELLEGASEEGKNKDEALNEILTKRKKK